MFRKLLFLSTAICLLMVCRSSLGADMKSKKPVDGKKAYSLTDFYRMALIRSESIKISEEDLYIAKKYKEKAFSVLVPRLSAFGGYTQYSEQKSAQGGAVIQPDWGAAWGLQLEQSFTLNGKELIAFRMAGKNINKFEYELYAEKESHLFHIASYYYNVVKAKEARAIAVANVKRLEKHRDAVQIRLKLEDVPKTALFRAEAELSKSKTDLIGAKNAERLAKATLATVLGMDQNFEVEYPDFNGDSIHIGSLEELKKEALRDRAEIQAIQMDKDISTDQIYLTRSNYWPTVSLEGKYSKHDQDPSGLMFNQESFSIGVQLNFLLYDGGLRNADVKETLSKHRQVQLAEKALEKQISIEIEKAYLEFTTQKSVLESSKDQLRFARENFDAVTQQFEHGLANSVDVMDANTLLTTSERQLSDAQYSYQLSVLGIERAKGWFLKSILEAL